MKSAGRSRRQICRGPLQMSHNGGPMIENLSREITANRADGMNVMNTHNVRANRRVNGAQHEHYVRITMEQKERARACEACTKVSGTHARARARTPRRSAGPMLHCYYLASASPVRQNANRCGIIGHERVPAGTAEIRENAGPSVRRFFSQIPQRWYYCIMFIVATSR